MNAQKPTCLKTLRGFLGLVQYYAKFINNFATILVPLYDLLKKGKSLVTWSKIHDESFQKAKEAIASDN